MECFVRFGIDDGEVFAVQRWISAEGEAAAVAAFKFGKEVGVFFFEAVEDLGVDHNDEISHLSFTALDDGV